ncbi:hypothetical protein [Bacillus phage 1_ICo-2020]|uniref:Uncharacterized protein n=1 Tax=Bacillus phage 1_ICo-2020 TaxID=2759272 RepID=A0A7G8AKH9_9CAUD|nr:hypothetical protein [Bacillus phage 1_ICo-2020]
MNQLTRDMQSNSYEEVLKHIEHIVKEVYGVKLGRKENNK